MIFQRDLQVKLQGRYRRIVKADSDVYGREVSYFRDFVLTTPALRAITDAIERSLPELDAEAWVTEHFTFQGYDWPNSETGRAKITWWLINEMADQRRDPLSIAHTISQESNFAAALRVLSDNVIEPFHEYLQERLGSESEMLYLLERYKRRLEWFDQERLFELFRSDTARGEALYDSNLRRYLLDQGVDYPFSQPASASGRADVVAELSSDDPLVCEIKLFDGASYGKPYVAKGFNQALQYAQDYGKPAGHLVVFNLSDRPIEMPSNEDPKHWPPRLHVANVTIFVVVVRAKPLPSASNQGKATPIVFSRADLVGDSA